MSETKASKPTVSIRPQPGQTELNWREWLILLGIIVVALVICTYGGRAVVRSFAAAPTTPTPTATRVRPPTVTLVPSPTAQPTVTPTPNIPTAVATGVYVTVIDGVNFRQEASTTSQIIRTLGAGEVLQVTEGPVTANERTWWKLKDPNGVEGWAAQDFLQPTAPPQ
ncbi:MAG TPA: SH3 domain-containing protein [Anaerolineae bacterium]|nr:SH3 domain-containing protein [Anaerolineae bacterium]